MNDSSKIFQVFAVIAAQNSQLRRYPRQDEDEEEAVPTPNPNVLPQVAQILGAIFSGNLNLTRIVDSTVGLVPNLVRNQIQGLVKLLTGENVNLTGETTTAVPPPPALPAGIIDEIAPQAPQVVQQVPQKPKEPAVAQTASVVAATTTIPNIEASPTGKGKYRVRNKTRRVPSTPSPLSLGDDEIDKYEQDLRAAAKLYEPYVQNKEPRFYAGAFTSILKNVNMTQVAQAVPSIFKGARQAFVMLDNLGVIDALPGIDVLDDLDVEEE